MDEVKAAAERLRQQARSAHGVGESPYEHRCIFASSAYVRDLRLVANAYLRSPPRDLFHAVCEALNTIAAWGDGPVVTSAFDSPWDARTAREALAHAAALALVTASAATP